MKFSNDEFLIQFNQLEILSFLKFLFEKLNYSKEKDLSET